MLVVAFLRLERLRAPRRAAGRRAGRRRGACSRCSLAPALDSDEPWWDYEGWSQSAARREVDDLPAGTTTTARSTGRATGASCCASSRRNRAYWKADALDDFDGTRWVAEANASGALAADFEHDGGIDLRACARWTFDIEVSVRGLRIEQL